MKKILLAIAVIVFSTTNLFSQKLSLKQLYRIYSSYDLSNYEPLLDSMGYKFSKVENNVVSYVSAHAREYQVDIKTQDDQIHIQSVTIISNQGGELVDWLFFKKEVDESVFKFQYSKVDDRKRMVYYYEYLKTLLILTKLAADPPYVSSQVTMTLYFMKE